MVQRNASKRERARLPQAEQYMHSHTGRDMQAERAGRPLAGRAGHEGAARQPQAVGHAYSTSI